MTAESRPQAGINVHSRRWAEATSYLDRALPVFPSLPARCVSGSLSRAMHSRACFSPLAAERPRRSRSLSEMNAQFRA